MREEYIRFNTSVIFVFINNNIYFEFTPAFVLNCYEDRSISNFITFLVPSIASVITVILMLN